MSPTKQTLHNLIDLVSPSDVNVLFHLLMKFVPEDDPTDDEIEAIEAAKKEIAAGEYVRHEDIDWD